MKCLKWFKKQKLIRKYKCTDKKMLNHIHLDRLLGNKHSAVQLSLYNRYCESRCLKRLKKL